MAATTFPVTPAFYMTFSSISRAFAIEIDRINNVTFVSGYHNIMGSTYSQLSAWSKTGNQYWEMS